MNMNEIYIQLTNINIEEQKKLWDERGKGYYGEFLVLCELYKNIIGNCKILMNLKIPTKNGKTTEIDLVLIHETGIYVFEIKHYKGTIYGDDTGNIWTQYFRTVKNNTFKNPILQNNYHIDALKNIFNEVPLKSIIVFTNDDCNLKVIIHNSDICLCKIYDLNETLEQTFKNLEIKYSIDEIDLMFNTLSKYSQMQETIVQDGKEASFISWLQPTLQALNKERNKLLIQIRKNKIKFVIGTIINTIAIVFCIFLTISFINSTRNSYNNKLEKAKRNYDSELRTFKQDYKTKLEKAKQDYNTELEKFKQNFKHVDEINNKHIATLNEHFSVSNVSLNAISKNTVTFTAKISRKNDIYGMALTEKSKYIVMKSNGQVYEYNVFGSHLNYNRNYNMIGKGIRDFGNLAKIQFHNISKEEIMYIKITNIELFELNISRTLIEKDLELEVYSK